MKWKCSQKEVEQKLTKLERDVSQEIQRRICNGVPKHRINGRIDKIQFRRKISQLCQEVTKKNGKSYPPDSLDNLVCGINRHLREQLGKPAFNVFAETEEFPKLKQT